MPLLLFSTRVSNELGAGNPQAARLSVIVVMVIAAMEPIIVSTALFCCRYFFGYLFSNEVEVIDYIREMIPILCIQVVMDSLQAVLSGQFPLTSDKNYILYYTSWFNFCVVTIN